jgi:hypothetical protein
MTQWIKISERLPEIGQPVFILLDSFSSFDEEEALHTSVAFAERIEKEHVPKELLEKHMKEDEGNSYDFYTRKGWVPGACYEFEERDHINFITSSYYFDHKCDDHHKFLLKEVAYWMPVPKLPEE